MEHHPGPGPIENSTDGLGAYHGVVRLLRFAVQVFFRRIEIVGEDNVPASGAVLFCGNHRNSMLDAVLITVFGGRVVHFAAADVVFEHPVLRFFLHRLKAVPVQRRQDHAGEQVDNQAAFSALFELLDAGGTIGIFPEGLSHDDSQLAKMKTGPARLAIGAKDRQPDAPIHIVPCGFYYTIPNRFRSSALLRFGEPVAVDLDRLEAWRTDERQAVRQLTDDLEERIRSLTVNAEDWGVIGLLNTVRRLYQPPHITLEERAILAHRFNKIYPAVAAQPDIEDLLTRVANYQEWLDALGLKDDDIRRRDGIQRLLLRGLGHATLLVFHLPLALLGAPVHLPVGLLVGWGSRRFAPRPDVVASTKFISGVLLLGLVYGLVIGGSFLQFGPETAGWAALLLPVTGLSTLRVLYRIRTLGNLARTGAEALLLGRSLKKLQADRAALVTDVNLAINRHVPPEMERLFLPTDQRD